MRTIRFYYIGNLQPNCVIELSATAGHHAINVLRLAKNMPVILFNGQGGEYQAVIHEVTKRSVQVAVSNFVQCEKELPIHLHLAQGLARGEKMDVIIQKAVELGVAMITPLQTEFSEMKLPSDRWQKKMQHWQAIIISACEQCGRNRLPILQEPQTFKQFIVQAQANHKIILDPRGSHKLPLLAAEQSAVIMVGPEGGFSHTEIALAQQENFSITQMGQRILRTETAALAALAVLQSNFN